MKKKYFQVTSGFIIGFFLIELIFGLGEGLSFVETLKNMDYLRVVGISILAGALFTWIRRKRIGDKN